MRFSFMDGIPAGNNAEGSLFKHLLKSGDN
jgi:hypothetical protein